MTFQTVMPAPTGNKNAAQAPDLRRSAKIEIRLTQAEKQQIQRDAGKRTITQYIRNRLGL